MKKLLFFIFLIMLSSSFIKSQNYHPLVNENKIWAEVSASWGSAFTSYYKLSGDTLINGNTYKKVYQSNDSLMQFWWPNSYFIREDSQHRVFKYFANEESLIYDFSLLIGDTILTNGYMGGQPIYAKVDSVDSVLINGEYRKKIIFDQWFHEFWIEGIGSSTTPFNPFINQFVADIGFYLLCVIDKDTLIYHIPDSNSCFVAFGSFVEDYDHPNLNLSPNPFSHSTRITFSQAYSTIALRVFNLQGQLVAENHYADCNETTLQLGTLSPGMYFLQLTLDGKTVETKKIVISE